MIQRDYQTFLAQTRATMQKFSSSMNQQVSGFEARQNASAAQSDSWGKILTGLTDARDPTRSAVPGLDRADSNYYINGPGDKRNANTSPGPTTTSCKPTEAKIDAVPLIGLKLFLI